MTQPLKKVLIFTDWYEPGYKAGGPIQSCRNIVALLGRSYSFYVFTGDRDLGDKDAYPGIKPDSWMTGANGEAIWYASPNSTGRNFFRDLFFSLRPDVVYFNSMFSWSYMIKPLISLLRSAYAGRIIIAPRGMLHPGALVRKTAKKKLFLSAMNNAGIMKRVVFHATNTEEARHISQFISRHAGIEVVQNIPGADNRPLAARLKHAGGLRILFVSRVHPKKNLQFAIRSLVALPVNCHVEFDIYGSEDDADYARSCKQLAQKLNNPHITITFKGPLNRAELFPTLRRYHLFYLPTLGENFGHAIFEALSSGCPVLISDQTNWTDIQSQNAGWSLALSDMGAFTSVLQKLCDMNQSAFDIHAQAALAYAKNYFAAQNLEAQYQKLFG